MAERLHADVVVVGAGPVGLTLAMDLAWRGVDVVVLESRVSGEPPSVKSNHVSARSMEIFRRIGVAQKVREADCRRIIPTTWSIAPRFSDAKSRASKFPTRAERYTAKDGPDTWWPTPEPPHRSTRSTSNRCCSPICWQCQARAFSTARRWSISRKARKASRPSPPRTAARSRFPARFRIGCDGGRSLVRRKIGATLSGDVALQHVQSSYIRAPKLLSMLLEQGGTPAWDPSH